MPDTKISDDAAAGTLDGTEVVPVVVGGSNERTTTQAIADLAAGGGAFALISTLTAAASATLAWTGLSGFNSWHLRAGLLLPATNAVDLRMRVGTGAGPTYITTGYDWALSYNNSITASGNTGGAAQAQVVLAGSASNTGRGCSVVLDLYTDNASFFALTALINTKASDGNFYAQRVAAGGDIAAPITAIQLYFSAGNITSGKASLYSVSA